jgi:deoxyribose-phosphate aldolase
MSFKTFTKSQLAACIDHSVLQPQLTLDEARAAIILGRELGVASCCVRPSDVLMATELLKGSKTVVSTVIGFPHGCTTTEVKVFEARQAIASGAIELDLVLNIARLRSNDLEYVLNDIQAVVAECKIQPGAFVKVILENAYLTDELKRIACQLSEKAGAAFVKTSTGFAVISDTGKSAGATIPDLILMKESVSPTIRVKAAGGVRTLDAMIDVLRAGAVRVGATATKVILEEFVKRVGEDGVLIINEKKDNSTNESVGGSY